MTEVFMNLFQMPNIIFVVGGIVAIVAIISENLRKAHVVSQENALKRELIGQGRSPEDIERIMHASARNRTKKQEG